MRLVFIGAGSVNFGGVDAGGPWNHSTRIEQLAAQFDITIVGVADPDVKRMAFVLQQRRAGPCPAPWAETRTFTDYKEMLEATHPDVAFVGVPPDCHGTIEMDLARAGVHMFIEKPLGNDDPERVRAIRDALRDEYSSLVVSVGYHLRYHAGVERLLAFLKDKTIISVSARYNSAYKSIPKPFWWDKARCGGPIIEQATHFCDLLRLVGGEVDKDSIAVSRVSPNAPAGTLSSVPCDEPSEPERRIPRATGAVFHFAASGALGTLTHSMSMGGTRYWTEFEVWFDGGRVLLHDPYTDACFFQVDWNEPERFDSEDPYFKEDEAFLTAVRDNNPGGVRCTFADAVNTYQLSWDITTRGQQ